MQFWSLKGRVPYEAARELQHKLVDLRARDLIEDTVLFLEHDPVITQGRGLQRTHPRAGERPAERPGGDDSPRHMPRPAFLPPDISFCETERGGDLTYHGPGQLVIYPIFKLDGEGFAPRHDVAGFLRKLESVLITELEDLGLRASAREGATGVWVKASEGEAGGTNSMSMRKIASIGIAVRKWVSYHGIAVNVVNDLKPFHLISPCGFSPNVMTRLADLVEENEVPGDWRAWFEKRLALRLSEQDRVQELSLMEAAARSSSGAAGPRLNSTAKMPQKTPD